MGFWGRVKKYSVTVLITEQTRGLESFINALAAENKKTRKRKLTGLERGERGIRTPGGVTLNSFQDCRIRPLCHFSFAVANIRCFFWI